MAGRRSRGIRRLIAAIGALLAVFASSALLPATAEANCFGGGTTLELRDRPPNHTGSFLVDCFCNLNNDLATVTVVSNDSNIATVSPMEAFAGSPPVATFTVTAAGVGLTSIDIDWVCPASSGSLPPITVNVTATENESCGAFLFQGTDADPVGTFNGELCDELPPDLDLGGSMPLRFSRYYASKLVSDGNVASRLGDNWLHNFDWALSTTATSGRAVTDRGRVVTFDRNGDDFTLTGKLDAPFQLTKSGTEFVLLDPRDELPRVFDADGRLIRIEDGRGNVHTLTYDAEGRLATVSDGLGRTLQFNGGDFLSSVEDGADATRNVRFFYQDRTIFRVVDTQNRVTEYSYDPGALLTAVERPLDNVPLTQTYGAEGRVATQSDADPNTTTFTYLGADTTITDPLGEARMHTHSTTGELTSSQDRAGLSVAIGSDPTGRRDSITDRLGDVTSFTYHAASGKRSSVAHADGTTTHLAYSARPTSNGTFHDLTGITQRDATTRSFGYDAAGNLLSSVDELGVAATATYNARGQILTRTSRLSGVTTHTYNPDGTLATRQDPAGNTTRFDYDARKRLTEVTFQDDNQILLGYDSRDLLTSWTDENGNATTFFYDSNRRLQRVSDPEGTVVELGYDASDRLTNVTAASGPTTRSYDALGRISTLMDGNGNPTTLAYDLVGRLASITDPSGEASFRNYDAEGVPASATDRAQQQTTFVSDEMGRITRITSPLQHTTKIGYDAMGRITTLTDPLDRTTTLDRDPRGLLERVTLADPALTAGYARNALGQITTLIDPNGQDWLSSYDTSGRLASRTDPLGNVRTFDYDVRNRPHTITFPGGLGTQTVTYDPAGNVTGVSHTDGTSITYTYDARGQLLTANNGSGPPDQVNRFYEIGSGRLMQANGISILRDAGKRITSMDLDQRGKTITYGYDVNSRVNEVTDWLGATTTLVYDARGLLTGIERPNGATTTRTYDDDGRLVGIAEAKVGGFSSSIALTRDAAGQITAATREVPQAASLDGVVDRTQTFDLASQLSDGTYDALGRLTARDSDTFTWNGVSQLVSYTVGGSPVDSTYDALGRRISRTEGGVTRTYVWNDALALPAITREREGSVDVRLYVHTLEGRLLYSIDPGTSSRRFYHYDEMGNTIFVTDDDGAVVASYAHTPYGELLASTGALDNPFTWQGEFGVVDEGNGLYYARARYYDSRSARFLSRDPVGATNPRGVNPYQYALANPKRFVDVTGAEPKNFDRLRLELEELKNEKIGIEFGAGFQRRGFLLEESERLDEISARIEKIELALAVGSPSRSDAVDAFTELVRRLGAGNREAATEPTLGDPSSPPPIVEDRTPRLPGWPAILSTSPCCRGPRAAGGTPVGFETVDNVRAASLDFPDDVLLPMEPLPPGFVLTPFDPLELALDPIDEWRLESIVPELCGIVILC